MTDSQIVMGIMQNDNRAWSHICRNMKPGFAGILGRSFTFGPSINEDIEDIFQDSCIILMQKVKEGAVKVGREGAIFSCLVQIGKYCACNRIRKKRPLTSEEMMTITLNLHNDDNDPDITVDEKQKTQDDFLDRVFESLPDTCRTIFKKFYWDHKPMDEIAGMIGYRNADSVKAKKNNCMNKFKSIAEKLIESDEFAEDAVRAAVERAALRELLEEERIYALSHIRIAALDIDENPDKSKE